MKTINFRPYLLPCNFLAQSSGLFPVIHWITNLLKEFITFLKKNSFTAKFGKEKKKKSFNWYLLWTWPLLFASVCLAGCKKSKNTCSQTETEPWALAHAWLSHDSLNTKSRALTVDCKMILTNKTHCIRNYAILHLSYGYQFN